MISGGGHLSTPPQTPVTPRNGSSHGFRAMRFGTHQWAQPAVTIGFFAIEQALFGKSRQLRLLLSEAQASSVRLL